MKLNIGFFLGSKFGKGKSFSDLTKKVAKWVNKNNHNIIFGGTETGIMKDLVVNLDKNESRVTAIITKGLMKDHNELNYFDELIIVEDLKKRTEQFLLRSDVFLALPGGIGTLFEIIEIFNKRVLGETSKKILLINDFDYWGPLKNLFEHMIKEEFLEKKIMLQNIEFINFCEIEERLKDVKNSS